VAACAVVALAPTSARAADAGQNEDEAVATRPVRWGSGELNPIAMLAGLFGGQAQVGVAGPVTLQAGLSYFGTGQNVRCAGSDGCSTTPGGHGAVLEVGPRIFFPWTPKARRPVFLWIGPAWGHNWMTVDSVHYSPSLTTAGASFEKNRLILDVGFHAPVGSSSPVYVLGGLGYSKALDNDGAGKLDPHSPNLASGIFDGLRPTQYVANGTSIRLVFAIGVGF
jgi:hypothetical protein